jgi:endonuclease YncB( thermonuclease family)
VAALVLAAASLIIYALSPESVEEIDAVVLPERVVDGDTLWVHSIYGFKAGQSFKVRLADIDTPERGEPGFLGAKNELNILVSNTCLLLAVDEPPYDLYGRVVAVVYIPISNDRLLNVNYVFVQKGLARYVDYPGSFHPEDFSPEIPLSAHLRSILNTYCT